jgi:HEAT repeat protein
VPGNRQISGTRWLKAIPSRRRQPINRTLEKLSGGDLRSEGRAAEIAPAIVVEEPDLLGELAQGLQSDDKLIRARTCMAIEVISRERPALLAPVVPQLIELAATETVPQARWHLAETFGRVSLSEADVERVVTHLLRYLSDKSKIVRYTAVDTLGLLGSGSARRAEITETIGRMMGVTKSLDKAVARALDVLGA